MLWTPKGHWGKFGLVVCVVSCWLAGCGGVKGRLETARVTGQVTYQGKPVSIGHIMFVPAEANGTGVRVAYGHFDEKGRYSLTTYEDDDGAILGKHRVVVVSTEEATPEMGKRETPEGLVVGRKLESFIPERYANADTSGLTAEVVAGNNTFDFDLED